VSAHSGEESSTALNGKPEAKVSKAVKQKLSNDRKTGIQSTHCLPVLLVLLSQTPTVRACSGGESGTGLNGKPGTKVSKAISLSPLILH